MTRLSHPFRRQLLRTPLLVAPLWLGAVACSDTEPSPEPDEAAWTIVQQNMDGALLSVWGTGSTDVYTVGSDARDGSGPYAFHWNGTAWQRIPTGLSGDLWWCWGQNLDEDPAADVVWMSGSGGLIARYDVAAGTVTQVPSPSGDPTLFGIFPLPGDTGVRTVGTVQSPTGTVGVYWDVAESGATDLAATLPAEAEGIGFFKIWGRGAQDLWMVGLGGYARLGPDGWTTEHLNEESRMFTVHGAGSLVVAVGGGVSGKIFEAAGDHLIEVTPDPAPTGLNGVWVVDDAHAVAVGAGGKVWRRTEAGWARDESAPLVGGDYHGVFVDERGGVWAVGGYVVSAPLRRGALGYWGTQQVGPLLP